MSSTPKAVTQNKLRDPIAGIDFFQSSPQTYQVNRDIQ